MMLNHTPGPWHTGTDEDAHIIYDDSLELVADAGREDGDGEAEAANARLIATAPDLLAACLKLVEADDTRSPGARSEGYMESIPLARAAIAKAEGRTNEQTQF